MTKITQRRKSRKGAAKIQYVPTDRFVKVSIDNLSIQGNKVFVAWRNDIHNGIPLDAYVLVPSAQSKHIILSIKDNGCGWIEANLPRERTVEFKLRFNVSPYYPEDKDAKGVKVRFEVFEPRTKQEPILETELDVFLQCNKSMNKVLRGSFDEFSSLSSSLSASNASGPTKEDSYVPPTIGASCVVSDTLIRIPCQMPPPIDIKFDSMSEFSNDCKRMNDFPEERLNSKRQKLQTSDPLFPQDHNNNINNKNPLSFSFSSSIDIKNWLSGNVALSDLGMDTEFKFSGNTFNVEPSFQLPYSCINPSL